MNKPEKKRKICVIVNSRANYGRIRSVLRAVQNHPDLELQLIVGASALLSRFGNVKNLITKDGFEPDATVYSIVEGENPTTMAKSTGMAIMELATLFENMKPDIVLTVADRFETMATAVAASYMNICLAHTQGGEVTGSIDESVRHAVTRLAHVHFPATNLAEDYLLRMGEDPSTVFMTGCPAIDEIAELDVSYDQTLFDRYGGVGPNLDINAPYLVVLQHPVTTEYGCGLNQIGQTLEAIKELKIQTVWLWPNVDAGSDDVSKGLRAFREKDDPGFIHFYKNFAIEDYARLINNSVCLLGNSSSGIREGSYLGVPVVNIGTRQQGRERAENVIDVDYDSHAIVEAVKLQVEHGKYESIAIYGDGKAGGRIAQHLADVDTMSIQKRLSYVKA
jgi:UDP-hydrolysing UDP-N-acetyl-D-glucosamine 2-epimerase